MRYSLATLLLLVAVFGLASGWLITTAAKNARIHDLESQLQVQWQNEASLSTMLTRLQADVGHQLRVIEGLRVEQMRRQRERFESPSNFAGPLREGEYYLGPIRQVLRPDGK